MNIRNPLVSISKCSSPHDFDIVKAAVKNVVDLIGGMESIISPGDTVLIKPNILSPSDYKTGATTNPNVVFSVAELCFESGAKEVIIGEGSAIGCDTDAAFDKLGYRELAKKYNCRLINFIKDEFVYTMNPLGKIMKRLRLPKTFIESNVVINVPVLKTHDALTVTLGLKNMKGVIHQSDKKRFHKWGLAQSVVDLGHLAMAELTIADGTIALEGAGPGASTGIPANLGLVLASTDTIACDRVCMEIMGFSLDEVEYIKLAGESNLGCTDLTKIKILGENIPSVKRPFKRLSYDPKILKDLNIDIIPCDACSGCNNAVNSYIYSQYIKGNIEKLRNCTIVYGQNPTVPDGINSKVILFGSCTRNLKSGTGGAQTIYVPGCPPHPFHVNDFLDGRGLIKE